MMRSRKWRSTLGGGIHCLRSEEEIDEIILDALKPEVIGLVEVEDLAIRARKCNEL